MSELRDVTGALSAISKSLESIERRVAEQDAHSTQIRLGLHQLRNQLQQGELERDEREKALTQIHVWMGSFSHKMTELKDSIVNLADTVRDGFKHDRGRLRALEADDEATQP